MMVSGANSVLGTVIIYIWVRVTHTCQLSNRTFEHVSVLMSPRCSASSRRSQVAEGYLLQLGGQGLNLFLVRLLSLVCLERAGHS